MTRQPLPEHIPLTHDEIRQAASGAADWLFQRHGVLSPDDVRAFVGTVSDDLAERITGRVEDPDALAMAWIVAFVDRWNDLAVAWTNAPRPYRPHA